MTNKNRCTLLYLFIILLAASNNLQAADDELRVASPDENIAVFIRNGPDALTYSVTFRGEAVLRESVLGFEFEGMPILKNGFVVLDTERSSVDYTWELLWGEQRLVRDHHNGLLIKLQEAAAPYRKLNIEFRVFDDGLGFRYLFPAQDGINEVIITEELTEFVFAGNHKGWYIPAYHEMKYEVLYDTARINDLGAVHTPFTMQTDDDLYISIHEAALVDYSSATLVGKGNNTLFTGLVPWQDGTKVRTTAPFKTPWRTIQIATRPGDLIESNLILNLNEPNVLEDVSWIQPVKYIGIWWGIHIDIWTFWQGEKLGATNENTLKYIDFAAKHGFDEVLVEGWNMGWTNQWLFNFCPDKNYTTPTPYFDMFSLQDHALSKGVSLMAYTETCGNTENFLSQIDTAFALYSDLGYRSVKVGHVNEKLVNGEWHHGQYGVNYYAKVVRKAVEHQLSINFHEPIKPTGLRRTYPNLMTAEGARGQEFNAWSHDGGNPPAHDCILPFTRLLAGPMDFTPGIFETTIPQKPNNQVNTTLAKQLALYVTVHSPVQMAADLIENYEGHPAFQFIKDVPVTWEETRVIDASIGEYLIIARKDRHSNDWYLGAITNEEAREFTFKPDFLNEGHSYKAQIYGDASDSDYETNSRAYRISQQNASSDQTITLNLARGGGAAIRFVYED